MQYTGSKSPILTPPESSGLELLMPPTGPYVISFLELGETTTARCESPVSTSCLLRRSWPSWPCLPTWKTCASGLSRIVVGTTRNGEPVSVQTLGVAGTLLTLLRHTI